MTREDMMRLALRQAEEAFAAGEVPVGCVIADAEGKIIGAGRNRREETHRADAHAEIEAIGQACEALGTWHLEDCTLVSDFALTAMQWATTVGVLRGDDIGRLNPTGTATRAEVAAMLMNFDQYRK